VSIGLVPAAPLPANAHTFSIAHTPLSDSIEARIRWKEDTKTPPNRYADGAAKVTRSGEYEDEAEKSSNDQRRLRPRPHLLTNASRGKLLKKELAKYNLTRRKDSKLCDAFVKGTTSKSVQEVTSASDQHHVHVQNQNEVSIRGLLQRVQHFSKRLL
jgi:hypothetical protein